MEQVGCIHGEKISILAADHGYLGQSYLGEANVVIPDVPNTDTAYMK